MGLPRRIVLNECHAVSCVIMPLMHQHAVTGVMLAGGQSRRLGRNKAVELVDGELLFTRVAKRLSSICNEIVVVVADKAQADLLPLPDQSKITTDVYPGKGSLGGIYSGIDAASNEWSIVVACDMPFLNVELLDYMLSLREAVGVVVPLVDGRPEPTHAAYSKICLAPIRQRLSRDELKITGFFDDVGVAYVPEADVRRIDMDLLTFFNVNTEEDLDKARGLAAKERQ